MPTYSQRYLVKPRKLPRFEGKYVLKYFPEELWSTLEPSREKNGTAAIPKRKIPIRKPVDTGKGKEIVLDGIEDEEEPAEAADPDEPPAEEEVDDEYASDEDEMAGDYNAEQYFDDGGDDAGEDYDGGDGDGGEY
jgi:DNA-directed RNA polymerase III subunit RPC7